MLNLNLAPIFRARNIERPYTFLVKNGFTHHSASNLINPRTPTIIMVHLERLCHVLNCEPSDLFAWKPDKNNPLPDNHPLHALRRKEPGYNWKQVFTTIPLNQLEEIAKIFNNPVKQPPPTDNR